MFHKCAALILSLWITDSLAFVKFEPVVKLFNNDPALDISYQNFDRTGAGANRPDIDVDNFVKSIECTYQGGFNPQQIARFRGTGFSSSGQIIFSLNPSEYSMSDNYNDGSCFEFDLSVARATDREGFGIFVVGMRFRDKVMITLAQANGRKKSPELKNIKDTQSLYSNFEYYVGEFDPNNRGDELMIKTYSDNEVRYDYYELSSLNLIRRVIGRHNGQVIVE